MRLAVTYSPKYTAIFEHPDTGVKVISFFVDDDNAPSIFAADEVWAEYNKEIARNAWKQFNDSGYYHTMSIKAEYVIDGTAYIDNIYYQDASIHDVMRVAPYKRGGENG